MGGYLGTASAEPIRRPVSREVLAGIREGKITADYAIAVKGLELKAGAKIEYVMAPVPPGTPEPPPGAATPVIAWVTMATTYKTFAEAMREFGVLFFGATGAVDAVRAIQAYNALIGSAPEEALGGVCVVGISLKDPTPPPAAASTPAASTPAATPAPAAVTPAATPAAATPAAATPAATPAAALAAATPAATPAAAPAAAKCKACVAGCSVCKK